ncbi:BAHD acyltransferase [Acorus calamus]|uniref:BAHD acyltransferase n=1 Tax=Acorus calamus TaxID=4465 RepID=A0AAV9EZK3_ACOCL|nr:BAHD acyltransferase [Acorus calamus]
MLSVQVLKRETIKPSTPTPPHLKFLDLSFLDQYIYNGSINVILFYSAAHPNGTAEISDRLRSSLSDTLTRFYPLAGRIKKCPSSDKIYVECNDEGVEFTTSRVEHDLDSFLADPPIMQLGQLFPMGGSSFSSYDRPLLSVQFNEFTPGGGCALGVTMSHKLADGTSFMEFLKAWADVTRGRGVHACPKFESAALFPPRDVLPEIQITPAAQSTARLLIRARQLETLRDSPAYAQERARTPTRVEAVIALLWRCAMRAAVGEARARRPEGLVPVNLRPRMRPQLTEDYFGNLFAVVYPSGGERVGEEHEQGFLEGRLREAISGLNGATHEELMAAAAVAAERAVKAAAERAVAIAAGAEEVERYMFTSWCRFPFYETDFGWGEPAWVAVPPFDLKNWFVLMSARGGDGVEVWAGLEEAEMEGFAKDLELLALTSSPATSVHALGS